MQVNKMTIMALCLAVSGCATVAGPEMVDFDQLPVIEFGQPVPEDGNFILHFPAGVAIATPVTFKGDLFEEAVSELVSVKPVRDIYVHKMWMSYDRQQWMDANQSLDLKVNVVLPGYHHPQPGYVELEMNTVN